MIECRGPRAPLLVCASWISPAAGLRDCSSMLQSLSPPSARQASSLSWLRRPPVLEAVSDVDFGAAALPSAPPGITSSRASPARRRRASPPPDRLGPLPAPSRRQCVTIGCGLGELSMNTSAPSSAASSTSRSTRSSRSRQGSARRPAPYARERGYDAGTAQASNGTAKGTATAILRSVCGLHPHEQPRTGANSVPRGSAFSGVFARVRLPSRIGKESGRQVARPTVAGDAAGRAQFRGRRLGDRHGQIKCLTFHRLSCGDAS